MLTSLVVVASLQQLALFFVFYFVYYSLFWFLHAKPKLLASSTASRKRLENEKWHEKKKIITQLYAGFTHTDTRKILLSRLSKEK